MTLSKNVNNKKCAPKFFNEKKIEKDSDIFWHRKLTLKVRVILHFLTPPHYLTQFSKFNNFLWGWWFLGKNPSNFVPPPPFWKPPNQYSHKPQFSKISWKHSSIKDQIETFNLSATVLYNQDDFVIYRYFWRPFANYDLYRISFNYWHFRKTMQFMIYSGFIQAQNRRKSRLFSLSTCNVAPSSDPNNHD